MSQPIEVYQLRVNIDINKGTKYPDQGYVNLGPERLGVSETLDLGSLDFMHIMKILGELHTAVEKIRHELPEQETLL